MNIKKIKNPETGGENIMNTKTRNGFSMIETLFALLITTALTATAMNYNKDTLSSTGTITKNTSLQQDTITAFQNITTDMSEGNEIVKDFTTKQNNNVSVKEVDCDNGDKGYIVITTSKNGGDTFASLDTCSKTNLDLDPIIGSL